MSTDSSEGSSLGVTKGAWLRFAEEVTSRWVQGGGQVQPEMVKFGEYLRQQRYKAGVDLVDLAADLDIPHERLVLLEQGLLKPSEVPTVAWVRLMRVLQGQAQRSAPSVAGSEAGAAGSSRPPVVPAVSSLTGPEGIDEARQVVGVARVRVIGIGGGGTNAVARMYRQRIAGVEYMAVNTDAQHLLRSDVPIKMRIGDRLTRGLGVGGDPQMGRESAEESREELYEAVRGYDLVFIAAGLGGGTGTGAAPVIAEIARESGALTIAVATKPFAFEGHQRAHQADLGVQRLRESVDTLILIPNDRLLGISDQHLTAENAFKLADEVLRQGVQAIAELITVPGEINLDFADLKAVMIGGGPAWMAIGTGRAENRAINAARAALASPLLDTPVDGARRVLLNITGGADLTLVEVRQAADFVSSQVDPDANIIFGMVTDPKMEDEVRMTVIATGLSTPEEELLGTESLEAILHETVGEAVEEEAEKAELPWLLRLLRSIGLGPRSRSR